MQNKRHPIQSASSTESTEASEALHSEAAETQNDEVVETPEAADNAEVAEAQIAEAADAGDPVAEDDADEDEYEDDPDFRAVLESLIFASDEPLTFRQIKDIVAPETPPSQEENADAPGRRRRQKKSFTITRVKRAIDVLNDEYDANGRSFRIVEVAGGFAFQTTKEFGGWVGKLFAERSRRRLTQSALETLSIIAFRQPISKPAVEGIRGVNAEYVVKSLLERNLISIVGREDSPGRPLLYGTTKTFLKHFGLSSINDLPKPREIKDLLASEDDLGSNPIEEMDPMKAAELTRVSSQELERLFENAQLRNEASDAADASVGDDAETATDAEEVRTPGDPAVREGDENAADVPPVLHVQFDEDGASAEALPDADGGDSNDPENAQTQDADAATTREDEITDDENETDDIAAETEHPAESDEAPVENPFDAEEPDEDERD